MAIFDDRRDAGRQLAQRLADYADRDPVVLALPRGGVPVGYEVAVALSAPLEVFVARKLGAPGHPELGLGAIAEGGGSVVNADALRMTGLDESALDAVLGRERAELARRVRHYRGERALPAIAGRTAILVDDGIATGGTARAALRALRGFEPSTLVLAVPVAPGDASQRLAGEMDDFVAVATPTVFQAVGQWYRSFGQTSDEEVRDLLTRAGAGTG